MSLIGALFAGASGLNSNSQALNVLGDNIANLNTVGFKGSQPVFGDLFSSILDSNTTTSQIGRGSTLIGVLPSFAQGSFETTLNSLDLAVNGSGFFIINDGVNNFFTRAGQFGINLDSLIQNINGEFLQGFLIDDAGVVSTTLSNIDLTGVQSRNPLRPPTSPWEPTWTDPRQWVRCSCPQLQFLIRSGAKSF